MTVWPLAALSVTVKVAVPAASLTVTSLIASDGAASSSVIVSVPVEPATLTVTVSLTSSSASRTTGIEIVKLVTPAGIKRVPTPAVTPLLKVRLP